MGNPVTVSVIKNIQQYLTHSAKADSIISNEKTYSEVIRDMVRKQIRFRGKVQGVGFRYHAKNAASSLGLTGWVRNESDGSVYMEVQGEDVLVERLLLNLNSDTYIDIQNVEIRSIDIVEKENGFSVAY